MSLPGHRSVLSVETQGHEKCDAVLVCVRRFVVN
jgi:hypothetical protein